MELQIGRWNHKISIFTNLSKRNTGIDLWLIENTLIIENYKNKDSNINEVLEEAAVFIGEPMANAIALLDLDKIILTGKTVQYFGEIVVNTIEKTLEGKINKWQSFKGIEVMEPFHIEEKCAKFVVENYFNI